MLFAPSPLGEKRLSDEALKKDCKECIKAGPCGLGKEAIYLGSRFFSRRYYLTYGETDRLYKRIAMSKGGFSGKGIFGTMSYLVAEYGKNEKQCSFKIETDVDRILSWIEREHPEIHTHSAEAEKRLEEAERKEKASYIDKLSPSAEKAVSRLENAKDHLEKKKEISDRLSEAAKNKRIVEGISPTLKTAAVITAAICLAAVITGIAAAMMNMPFGIYLALFAGVFLVLIFTSGILPSRWNNRKNALNEWNAAVSASRRYTGELNDFPVPPQYAHPVVCDRMIRVIRQGRAETAGEALGVVKDDLKALNSSVTVSQKEHDEVVEVKPMFLVCDYE
ncbi:MAG: ATPase P [Lachnospiraceae bacterium]|nr:ATPase P [Lachnospiraceae bacterium]